MSTKRFVIGDIPNCFGLLCLHLFCLHLLYCCTGISVHIYICILVHISYLQSVAKKDEFQQFQCYTFSDNLTKKRKLRMTALQFGLVHHFTKLGSGEYYLEELEHEVIVGTG